MNAFAELRGYVDQVRQAASGRWRQTLMAAGIGAQFLHNRGGPCPGCGGRDRHRFDDRDGRGTFFCNRGGGEPLAGDGFALLEHVYGCSFLGAVDMVAGALGIIRPDGKMPEKPIARAQSISTVRVTRAKRSFDGYLDGRFIRPGETLELPPHMSAGDNLELVEEEAWVANVSEPDFTTHRPGVRAHHGVRQQDEPSRLPAPSQVEAGAAAVEPVRAPMGFGTLSVPAPVRAGVRASRGSAPGEVMSAPKSADSSVGRNGLDDWIERRIEADQARRLTVEKFRLQRSQAWLKRRAQAADRPVAKRCGAHARSSGQACQAKALANGRCRNHGGMSTGPRTEDGRRRAMANLKQNHGVG